MRQQATLNGISIKGFSGTTGIMLAFNIEPALRKNFLGFAIERTDKKKKAWLQGALHFPGATDNSFALVDSNLAPIQKFRWSDYSVYEGGTYTYKVYGVYGKPGKLTYREGPEITLTTQVSKGNKYEVVFNRAVAASQSYEKRFGQTKPNDTTDPNYKAARTWLSRGIKEKLLNFLLRATDNTFRLDVAIYEFEVMEAVETLNKIAAKGVPIRVMFHWKDKDPQTEENEKHIHALDPRIEVIPRKTHKIFHHKFVVLYQNGTPVSVLSGSTNFTNNAFYLQANVVHIINEAATAQRFAYLFEQLCLDIADKANVKKYNDLATTQAIQDGIQTIFSPKKVTSDIGRIVDILNNAQANFFLCSAFDIHADILAAIEKSDKIRYGLQNSRSKLTGFHRNQSFVIPDFLRDPIGAAFKEESSKRRGKEGSIYIHLKTFLVDFGTDHPTVIFGSNNFSQSASTGNDENLVIIENDTDLADIYMVEMFRLYDHYRFRYSTNAKKAKTDTIAPADGTTPNAKTVGLTADNSWTKDYFDKKHSKFSERLMFG